jgi:hypothetical protein
MTSRNVKARVHESDVVQTHCPVPRPRTLQPRQQVRVGPDEEKRAESMGILANCTKRILQPLR